MVTAFVWTLPPLLLGGPPGEMRDLALAWLTAGLLLGVQSQLLVIPTLVLLAVPAFLLLRRMGRASWRSCLLAALMPSLAVLLAGDARFALRVVLPFSLPCALAFWWFARHVAVRPPAKGPRP